MKMKFIVSLVTLFVIFSASSVVNAVPISREEFNSSAQEFVFPEPGPYPTTTITTNDFNVTGGLLQSDGYNDYNGFIIDFTFDISALGMDIIRWKSSTIEMSVYDSSDNLLENNVFIVSSYPDFIGVDVGSNSISWAWINAGDDIWVDNIIYQNENTPAPVPEPATMLLFGTGLAGLIGSRMRRKKW
jgi:hypothetical protein